MSGGGGTNTVQQNADPWRPQQQYLLELFDKARSAANNPPQYYPGQTIAAQQPETVQAQQLAREQAMGGSTALANDATAAARFNLTNARNVESNPYLQSAIQAAVRPVYQNLTETALPAIGAGAERAGQYGSSRQGIAEGLAISRAGQTAGDIAASMANRGYETGLDASTKALALTPTVQQAGLAPAQTLDAIGQQNQAYQQALIDASVNKWNFEQNLPWLQAQNYQQILQGAYGGSSTTTSPGATTNPVLSAMGGAAAGYGLASTGALGATFAANPLIGAGLGAVMLLMMSQS